MDENPRAREGSNTSDTRKKVLFICTYNSARSQMAEAFLNLLYGDRYQAFSAGTKPSRVHPLAVKAMAEVGIDISGYRSKGVEEFLDKTFQTVVTVCDNAREACPYFPGAHRQIHRGFEEPSSSEGSADEQLVVFRRVRDNIRAWVSETFAQRSPTAATKIGSAV
ncbi:MAG: arsenate reductase ArsC [Thermodesulfobacteriota bacterium]